MARLGFSPATGSVEIAVVTPPVATAPAAIFFTAQNHAGFSPFEGTGAEYDGAYHEIEHIWTVRGQPLPNFTKPQNFLAVWRNANVSYGKEVTFRFTEPGTYIVDLWCVDRKGISASASASVAVVSANSAYPGASTICYSEDPNERWDGAPDGCRKVTAWDDIKPELFDQSGHTPHRLLFKRGSTVEPKTSITIDNRHNLAHIGGWGVGADPVLTNYTRLNPRNIFYYQGGVHNDQITVEGLRFLGGWDSGREVGYNTPGPVFWREVFTKPMHIHLHNCSWDGIDNFALTTKTDASDTWITVSDCDATNWSNYAHFSGGGSLNRVAIIGCRYTQADDALNGALLKAGVSNQHNAIRVNRSRSLYIACCDLFARGGWSGGINNVNGFPEPADQPCLRLFTEGDFGDRAMIDRVVCEGGYHNIKISSFGETQIVHPGNILMDRVLCIGTAKTTSELVFVGHGGFTARNVVGIVPGTPRRQNLDPESLFHFRYQDLRGSGNEDHSQAVYNCTAVFLRTTGPTFATTAADPEWADLTFERNLSHAPNIGLAEPSLDIGATMPDIMARYKGVRFNFEPLVMEPGDPNLPAGPVTVNQSFVVPYDRFTDKLVGGDPSTATVTDQTYWQQVEAESAAAGYIPRHTFNTQTAGLTAYTELDEFSVAFEASGVRFTNTSGIDWNLPTSSGKPWAIRLDRSVNIPAMLNAFDSTGPVPLPRAVGTLQSSEKGRSTTQDFFLNPRGGIVSAGALLP